MWETDPEGSDDGWHSIYAKAYDLAGNALISSASQIEVYSLDSIVPSLVELIAFGPFTGNINLYANVYDGESGIAFVEYWDGDPSLENSVLLGWSDVSGNSYNLLWITDPYGGDDGNHTIFARAYDIAGNFKTSEGLVIEIAIPILSEEASTFWSTSGTVFLAGTVAFVTGSLLQKPLGNLIGKKKIA